MNRKHLIIYLLSLLLPVCNAAAQSAFGGKILEKHYGRVVMGGLVSAWYDTDAKNKSFAIEPEIGYLFTDDWGLGIKLGYAYSDAMPGHNVMVSPFVRYYYFHKEPFNLYLDGGIGWNARVRRGAETWHGFEAGVRPGACVDLTEGLCLCLRFGFVGYRRNFDHGEEEGLSPSGFGIRFAPEELSLGLELEF